MESVWNKTTEFKKFNRLDKNIKTDVLVVGGGITGLLCAHALKNAGVDYCVAEAGRICSGITKNTTAKITSQHGLCYSKLIKSCGPEKAGLYLKANEDAVKEYYRLCSKIDCNFEEKSSFVYSVDDEQLMDDELNALQKLRFPARFQRELPLLFKTVGAVKFEYQAQFNPLKFLSAISDNLNIYENTRVCEIMENVAYCNGASIKANIIIVATHFPFINKHGSYFLKMYQQRSYVAALENAQNLNGMYIDADKNGFSLRNYKNYLLLGGGGHRTGTPSNGWQPLKEFKEKYYPGSEIKYYFSTQDCMTLDKIPYIGRYSARTHNLFVATGFNKWGMTSSMVAAKVLCDMVCRKDNEFIDLFSPSRSIIKPQLVINAGHALAGMVNFGTKRCPHLGCALKWNKSEHSWDCPCHGSRFTKNGKLIDNPATGDIK